MSPTAHPARGLARWLTAAAAVLTGLPQAPRSAAQAQPAASAPSASRPADAALPAAALVRLKALQPPVGELKKPPASENMMPQAQRALAEARKLMAEGNHIRAVERLDRAVGFHPDSPTILRALGEAHYQNRSWGKAQANLEKAARLAGDDLDLQLRIALLAARQQDTAGTILAYRAALACSEAKSQPAAAAVALLRLAELLDETGRWTAALDACAMLEEWIDRNGRAYAEDRSLREVVLNPEGLMARRARLLKKLRRPAEAADVLERVHRRDRSDIEVGGELVDALIAARRFRRVEELLAEMADADAYRPVLPKLAEALLAAEADRAAPLRLFQALSARGRPNGALVAVLAEAALKLKAPDQAERIVRSAVSAVPDSPRLVRLLVSMNARAGEAAKALDLLAELLGPDPAGVGSIAEGVQEVVSSGLKEGFERTFADRAASAPAAKRHALHYVAGLLARQRGMALLAADQFRRAIQAKPAFLPGYEALIDIYIDQRRPDQAERVLRDLAKSVQEHYFSHYLDGKVKFAARKYRDAATALERSVALNESCVPVRTLLAQAYRRLGRDAEAAQIITGTIALQPDNVELHRALFELYVATGRYLSAERLVAELLQRLPGSLQGNLMQAELDLLRDRRTEALELLKRLRRNHPDDLDVKLLSLKAELALNAGLVPEKQFRLSVEQLSRLIRQCPDSLPAKRVLARLLANPGQHANAAAVWEQIYRQSGEAEAGRAYSDELIKSERYALAADVLAELARNNPLDLTSKRSLIQALAAAKKYDEATAHLQRWIKEDKDPTPARANWYRLRQIEVYKDAKQYAKARRLIDAWLPDLVDDERLQEVVRSEKVRLLAREAKYDEAAKLADQLVAASPADLFPRHALVWTLIDMKQYDRVHPLLDRWLLARDVHAERYRRMKIAAYGEAKKPDLARRYALRCIEKDPDSLDLRELLVAVLAQADQEAEALAIVDGWLGAAPASAPATQATRPAQIDLTADVGQFCRQTAVRLLVSLGRYKEGAARVAGYLAADPTDHELLSLQAACLEELGREKEALASMAKALAGEPDDPSLNNNLGYKYADTGIKLKEAEEMIRKALRLRMATHGRTETAFVDSLGWALYKQGKMRSAGGIFHKLIADAPEDLDHPVIFDHAGDAYERLGWRDKAETMWIRARELAAGEKHQTLEIRRVRAAIAAKLKALKEGKPPPLAPLGEGVTIEADGE